MSVARERNVWTSSTHAAFSHPAQRTVHVAAAVLWKLSKMNPQMDLPYELVQLIFGQVREPRKQR